MVDSSEKEAIQDVLVKYGICFNPSYGGFFGKSLRENISQTA